MNPALATVTLSRTSAYLTPLAEALAAQEGAPEFGQLLVDNGCTEYPAGLLSGFAVVRPGYNTTYAAGNNLGVKVARQVWPALTHVLLLNDDCKPLPNMVAGLWRHRDEAAVVGALLFNRDGTVNHAGARVWPRPADPHVGRGGAGRENLGTPLVQAVTFACALIDLRAWDALKGLEEGYAYGYEDTDFCIRAVEAGHLIRVACAAVGVHDECGTRPRGGARDAANAALFLRRLPDAKVERIYARYAARARRLGESVLA